MKDIENATLEAIYWWNRDEGYYHDYFSRLDKIRKQSSVSDFFISKVFRSFLREYSVRRNISAGSEMPKLFINELFEFDFFKHVQNGEISIIDEVSKKLLDSKLSTKRNTRSLLSKIAFLINPNDFALYDSLSKKAIWKIIKMDKTVKQKELNKYESFSTQVNKYRYMVSKTGSFEKVNSILGEFEGTDAFNFFSKNKDAFEMRIMDKYLWINGQEPEQLVDNSGYYEFIKLNK